MHTHLLALVLCTLALWLPQNVMHEGAHTVVHWLIGDKITGFWPLPGWKTGGFTFAHMTYRRPHPVSSESDAIASCIPQLSNTAVLLVLLPLHLHSLGVLPVAWAIVNFADGAANLGTFYRAMPKHTTDGWHTAKLLSLNPWSCRAVALVWHLLMGVHVGFLVREVLSSS